MSLPSGMPQGLLEVSRKKRRFALEGISPHKKMSLSVKPHPSFLGFMPRFSPQTQSLLPPGPALVLAQVWSPGTDSRALRAAGGTMSCHL